MKRILIPLALMLSAFGSAVALPLIVRAAPLTYSTATTISLTSPATTLTIATGSVADAVQVNATSVLVTLSSSTGGSFTLTAAASYDLSISSSTAGGTVSLSCVTGMASTTISQSSGQTIYTISPLAEQCTPATTSTPVVVSVGSGYGQPYVPGVGLTGTSTASSATVATTTQPIIPAASTTTTNASLLSELSALQSQLASLRSQASHAPTTRFMFTRNLSLWNTGPDVQNLQLVLIAQAKGPAAARLKSHGASRIFGPLTYDALIEFQKSVGINPARGHFGSQTRAYVNANQR